MQKIILCAALVACGVCNTYAQSSVTLYGRVASGLDFVTNVATPQRSVEKQLQVRQRPVRIQLVWSARH
jgi:predicted porin